jgi:putative ABC transport system substrate-binding protein
MRRRDFIRGIVGSAGAWPLVARAQQPPMPVIGFLHPGFREGFADRVRGFREGLKEIGYVEGQNVAIEYRWAENQFDRLPALAAELVRRQVAVIMTAGPATFAAKAATTTTPLVFIAAEDPVKLGLVRSLARPAGNLTGINFLNTEVGAKRLELLRELVPATVRIAVLVDPSATGAKATLTELEAASRAAGLQIQVHNVSTPREIDAVFEGFVRERPDALFAPVSSFLVDRRVQLALQAAIYRVPATYPLREFAEAGGLMSYGASLKDAFRQAGIYAGRILKGAQPADLPVVQATKFELVINHQSARMIGLTVPQSLLTIADEVIE